ncbi:MAG: pyrimidine dimer DNA glycosylase/endonuclease V [Nitrospirota bacterium]|nr:pyrimidine dimer DNA glycosylase/endonuclease V [Nitrospirota bacterium]
MRLWSIHPQYLDAKGLVALWREGLLAQKVLLGRTKGYRSHPQLDRFRECSDPIRAIGCYLAEVLKEAEQRGYRFNGAKIVKAGRCGKLKIRKGQIDHEWEHLLGKLRTRDRKTYALHKALARPRPHPLFRIVPGGVEEWERV